MDPSTPPVPGPVGFISLSGAVEHAEAAVQLVKQARVSLALLSVELDQHLFGTSRFADQLRNFVLQHRRAHLRVLVHEPAKAIRNSPRLAELGRALSSRIEFRIVGEVGRKQTGEFLIADDRALMYRGAQSDPGAKLYADAPLVARSHLRAFEALWTDARVAREFAVPKT